MELNIKNKGALFLSKAIYDDFKGDGEEGLEDELDEDEIKLARFLEETAILDKAK